MPQVSKAWQVLMPPFGSVIREAPAEAHVVALNDIVHRVEFVPFTYMDNLWQVLEHHITTGPDAEGDHGDQLKLCAVF